MKRIIVVILALLAFQFSFSQTEKLLKGKVSDKEFAIQGADVINFSNQKSTITNSDGVFYILAKANDIVLIHHKNYTDIKVILSQKDMNGGLAVELVVKPTQLEEVVIDKGSSMGIHITQADIDGMRLLKNAERPKVVGINDGSIPNGIDFVRLGKDAYKLIKKMFKSDSKNSKGNPEIMFKEYVKANVNRDYFVRYLKLQPSEIPLFIEFCDADSKSKVISDQPNIFSVMDFLSAKNIEFQKLLSLVK